MTKKQNNHIEPIKTVDGSYTTSESGNGNFIKFPDTTHYTTKEVSVRRVVYKLK